MLFLPFLLLSASLAAAINFTSPDAGDTLSRGSTFTLEWTSVDTDPTQFDIYLWNFVYYPPFYHYIKTVQTNALSTPITIPCDVTSEDGWQFTAVQNMNVYVINAQTPKFNIDNTACNSPNVGPNPERCPSTSTLVLNGGSGSPSSDAGPGATVTVTVSLPAVDPTPSTCTKKTITAVSTSTVYKKTTTATTTLYKNTSTSTTTAVSTKTVYKKKWGHHHTTYRH